MARVVRPGGRVVILEITTPARLRPLLRPLVRPRGAAAREAARPRLGRLLLPAGVGPPVPRAARARGPHGRRRARRRALARSRGGHHRPAPRTRRVTSAAPLPPLVRPMTPLLALCEQRLRDAVAGHAEEVVRPAEDTLAAGGKRVRPLLVFCAAPQAARPRAPRATTCSRPAPRWSWCTWRPWCTTTCSTAPPCGAGRPTVAQSLGADRAVSTGDFLFARAFGELTRTGSPRAVSSLAAAALDLSQGEMDQQRAAFDVDLTEEAYLSRCRRKTAALFSVACRLGAMVGGAGRDAEDRLAAFGENVGMAFQIFDDILDLAGAPGRDRQAPGHRSVRRHRDAAGDPGACRSSRACAARWPPPHQGPGLDELCDRLAGHEGLRLARERALAFVARARTRHRGGPGRRRRRARPARDRRRRRGPVLVSAPAGPAPASRDEIEALLRAGDPLAAARAAGVTPGAGVAVTSEGEAGDRLADGDARGRARGPPRRARGGAAQRGRRRLRRRARPGRRWPSGSPAWPRSPGRPDCCAPSARCPPRAAPERPGSWGVEDLTVIAVCRLALPAGVEVRPHWVRLGAAACQIAVAFGATEWRDPCRRRQRPRAPGRGGRARR